MRLRHVRLGFVALLFFLGSIVAAHSESTSPPRNLVNVRDTGAHGDGRIDDTAALQKSVDALVQRGGGEVVVPQGTYLVSKAIVVPATRMGITISGSGPNLSVIRSSSATEDVLAIRGGEFVTIHDLQLEVTRVDRSAGAGLRMSGVHQFVIDNVRVIGCFDDFVFDGCQNGFLSRLRIAGGYGKTHAGLSFLACVSIHLHDLIAHLGIEKLPEDSAVLRVDSGCDTFSAADVEIAVTPGEGAATGVLITHSRAPASFAPRWIRFTSTFLEAGPTRVAMRMADGNGVYVSQSYFASSLRGLDVDGGRDVRVGSSQILNCRREAIRIGAASNVSIADTTVSDISSERDGAFSGILVDASARAVSVSGCTFDNVALRTARRMKSAVEDPAKKATVDRSSIGAAVDASSRQ